MGRPSTRSRCGRWSHWSTTGPRRPWGQEWGGEAQEGGPGGGRIEAVKAVHTEEARCSQASRALRERGRGEAQVRRRPRTLRAAAHRTAKRPMQGSASWHARAPPDTSPDLMVQPWRPSSASCAGVQLVAPALLCFGGGQPAGGMRGWSSRVGARRLVGCRAGQSQASVTTGQPPKPPLSPGPRLAPRDSRRVGGQQRDGDLDAVQLSVVLV
jgi:hypothetical protein